MKTKKPFAIRAFKWVVQASFLILFVAILLPIVARTFNVSQGSRFTPLALDVKLQYADRKIVEAMASKTTPEERTARFQKLIRQLETPNESIEFNGKELGVDLHNKRADIVFADVPEYLMQADMLVHVVRGLLVLSFFFCLSRLTGEAYEGKFFSKANARYLRIMGFVCLGVMILGIVGKILIESYFNRVVILENGFFESTDRLDVTLELPSTMFLVLFGLSFFVLAEFIKYGNQLQQENQLTI